MSGPYPNDDAAFIASGVFDVDRLGTGADGAGLKALFDDGVWAVPSGVAVTNFADNRVVTSGATASDVNAEANLTFDGTRLRYFNSDGECFSVYSDNKFNLYVGLNCGDASATDPGTAGGEPGTANTGFGYQVLQFAGALARYNSGFGTHALNAITDGEFDSCFGANAGLALQSGDGNLYAGHNCGQTNVSGSYNVGAGARALEKATGSFTTAVGGLSLAKLTTGQFTTAVGYNSGPAQLTGSSNQYFGLGAGTAHIGSACIIVGVNSEASAAAASNEAVFGSSITVINNVYFGKGARSTAPTAYAINGTGGTGTDIAGGDVIIAGGRGTGTGISGKVRVQVAPAGASGASNNTLVDAASYDDSATAGNTRFLLYDVDSAAVVRVSVGAADSGGTGFKVLRIPN